MRRTKPSPILLASLLAFTGCDKFAEAVEQKTEELAEAASNPAGVAAGAQPLSEDEMLGEKLNGYISCINGVSSRVLDTADRYYSWVNPETGLTGKERIKYGLFDVDDPTTCYEAVTKSNAAEPKLEDLETAATAFVTALKAVQPTIHETYKYYDEENFKDDDFAKGKELDAKLAEQFKAFKEADTKLRELVAGQNEGLLERELTRVEKEEGRKLKFHAKNTMALAKKLMKVVETDTPDTIEGLDLDALNAAIDSFEKSLDECEKYAKEHKAEADSVTMFSSYTDSGREFLKEAKNLMRRKRDGQEFTKKELNDLATFPHTVEGHPFNINKKFNDMISRSNGLSWNWYKPDP